MNREIQNSKSAIRNPDSAVDELLISFFRSEMPQPWPDCSAQPRIEDGGSKIGGGGSRIENKVNSSRDDILHPPSSVVDPPSPILHPRSSSRSRWVLAASVAILLIGSWWLGQRFAAIESNISPTSSGKMIGSKLQPGKNKPPRHLSKTVVP